MAEEYLKMKELYESATPFAPNLPPHLHTTIGFGLLFTAFGVGFTFTTLPNKGLAFAEFFLAIMSSLLTGFGVVFLFNAAGVYL